MNQPYVATKVDHSRGARVGFWVVALLGLPASAVAWLWYGFAQFEAQEEQGKARAAGTTMAGFAKHWAAFLLCLLCQTSTSMRAIHRECARRDAYRTAGCMRYRKNRGNALSYTGV